ncbi:RloB family protein [Arcicella aquatica]|uniref:RloB family protein n=1 Tax=Arcicella aquatica TaxID=217141 RepID=A0ABU5QSE8_9BACT|nr:RloB family protein [Arcicella aquatica]MEA5260025.1 RloB family protein [Arcicella aquatica]
MLLRNRPFNREEPERSATKIYIFCEGKDREFKYFQYFEGIDSRLNLIVHELNSSDNNSPKGLLLLAKNSLIKSSENLEPKYDYREGDKVWIVLDTDEDKTDSRKPQLIEVRDYCNNRVNWNVAQSNPCFEVWLYYHQENEKPNFERLEICNEWKPFVGQTIKGGFNPRKHPILIQNAITNSKPHFEIDEIGFPIIATTEVFKLANDILSIGRIRDKIEKELQDID